MEDHGVTSLAMAERALRNKTVRQDVIARAAAVVVQTDFKDKPPSAIVAGRALDLSGDLDCYAWDILRARVDELFHKVWHYFDRVVIVGADARRFARDYDDPSLFDKRLLLYVQLLLHLRAIGADELVLFCQKPPVGDEEFDPRSEFVRSAVGDSVILRWLIEGGAVTDATQHEDHFHYRFDHPEMEHTTWGAVQGVVSELNQRELMLVVATAVTARFSAHLASDIQAAEKWGCPLGIGINFHCHMASLRAKAATVEDVVFQLDLPVIEGIDARDLIQLRKDEHDHFEAFRTALRRATAEKIAAIGGCSSRLAVEIQNDLLNPALVDLKRRLSAAKRALAKKASLRIGISALATTCGLLGGQPLLTTAGVGGALSALGALDSYMDTKKDVEISDMYFLLRATSLPH